MQYRAAINFRTTLEQAGRIAGIAGELEVSEAEVTRRLIDRALEQLGSRVLPELRAELARDERRRREAWSDAAAELAARDGSVLVESLADVVSVADD